MTVPVLWISIGFNADPESSFLSQCGSGYGSRKTNQCRSRQIRNPYQTFESQKVEFLYEKYTKNRLKNIPTKVHKSLFERQKKRFICKF
jgi:hypothetical protein